MGVPLLIHQMGKVGSTSLLDQLDGSPGYDTLHTHHLDDETLDSVERDYLSRGKRLPDHLVRSRIAKAGLLAAGRPLTIVTAVREPIARNVSAFFQNMDLYDTRFSTDPDEYVAGLIARFLESYPHQVPLEWFDRQVKGPLGIDVYRHPFPHEAGWQVVEENGHRMLILRAETPDAVKVEAVNDFLGTRLSVMPRANAASDKYGELYASFLDLLRLPDDYVDRLLGSTYARHFYSAAEIETFRARWRTVSS